MKRLLSGRSALAVDQVGSSLQQQPEAARASGLAYEVRCGGAIGLACEILARTCAEQNCNSVTVHIVRMAVFCTHVKWSRSTTRSLVDLVAHHTWRGKPLQNGGCASSGGCVQPRIVSSSFPLRHQLWWWQWQSLEAAS